MLTGEGMPWRANLASRPLAVGPRSQEEAAEQAAGRFLLLGRLMSVLFYCFFYFTEAISIVF